MLKKIVIPVVSLATLLSASNIESKISSVLPSDKEKVRCFYNNVAIKFDKSVQEKKLLSYHIKVFNKDGLIEVPGKTESEDNFLIFTPNKPFRCNAEFISVFLKDSTKNLNKNQIKNFPYWSFSTEENVNESFVNYKDEVLEKTPILLDNSILNKVFDPNLIDARAKKYEIERNKQVTLKNNQKQNQGQIEEFRIKEELKDVVKLISNKKWAEVEAKTLEMFEVAPSSPRVNFYLGMAYFNQKKFDDAAGAYERVIIVEPNHITARLELAKTMFMVKQYSEAERGFEEILNDFETIPPAVEKNINYFLTAIEKLKKRHTLVFIAMGELKQEIKKETKNAGNEKYNDNLHQEILVTSYTYDYGKLGGWKSVNNLIVINNSKFNCSGDTASNNKAHCRSGVEGAMLTVGTSGDTEYGNFGISATKPFLTAYTDNNNAKKKVEVDGLDLKTMYAYSLAKDMKVSFDYTFKDGTTVMDDLNLADKLADGYIFNSVFTKLYGKKSKVDFKYTFQDIKEKTEGNANDYENKNTKKLSVSYLQNFNKKLSLNTGFEFIKEDLNNNLDDTSDYKKNGRIINLKTSYKYKPNTVFSAGLINEDSKKSFIRSGGSKFNEETKGNTFSLGVMYIFTPINF